MSESTFEMEQTYNPQSIEAETYQRWETSSLVLVPAHRSFSSLGGGSWEVEYFAFDVPVQQVIALCQPSGIATAVGAVLAIVTDEGHIPCAVLTEHRRTVVLLVVAFRRYDKSVFVGGLRVFINLLHTLLCHGLCRERQDAQK